MAVKLNSLKVIYSGCFDKINKDKKSMKLTKIVKIEDVKIHMFFNFNEIFGKNRT